MTWDEVRLWRRDTRKKLMKARLGLKGEDRAARDARIRDTLAAVIGEQRAATVGLYWPIGGEFDTRPLAEDLRSRGVRTALPAIVEKKAPVVYRPWDADTTLEPGVWNIPTPATPVTVVPDLVLAPVIGFDSGCYRLGFGGGYFDRTLAALRPKPVAVGVGYELAVLDTIHPQPHDIPMDLIVTEAGRRTRDGDQAEAPSAAAAR